MGFPTRFTVPGLPDGQCWARPCLVVGENKGNFVKGRGYTSYFKEPKPICTCNYYNGCPHPLPAPDPEQARCCFRPDYRRKGQAPTGQRQCETCGAHAPLKVAKTLNTLPGWPGMPCKHIFEGLPTLLIGWFECASCKGLWDHRPQAFEVTQYTWDEMLAELKLRLSRVTSAMPPKE